MKREWLFVIAILMIGLLCSGESIYGCDLSDKEAIGLSVNFCSKMGIICSQEPWVLRTDHYFRVSDLEKKEVVFGARGDFKIFMSVSCNNKEVDYFDNSELEQQVRIKYKIPNNTQVPHNWPLFLSETKAREKILTVANKIGLPKDAEFKAVGLDKENGQWSATWIRKYNGFHYENDHINIKIMAVDGEFYSYGKYYVGKPCPTEVKVSKEKAIEAGSREIWRLRGIMLQIPNYEIASAEVKIVQPNTRMDKITGNLSTESRLAWVLVYELKSQHEADCPQRITIKIDAGTKEFLGGDFTRC